MAEQMMLVLAEDERSAVAQELRRYGNYREDIGADLWDSHVLPEPGEPDPAGITPQVEKMIDGHITVGEDCASLAAAFESTAPVLLTLPSIQLIEDALSEAYPDGLFPEVARTAMFCRIAHRRLTQASAADALDEAVAVNAEMQPVATAPAEAALAQRLEEVNATLSQQLVQLHGSQESLNERVTAQQRQIEQLRNQGGKRRRLPNPFSSTFDSGQSRRPSGTGLGRTL